MPLIRVPNIPEEYIFANIKITVHRNFRVVKEDTAEPRYSHRITMQTPKGKKDFFRHGSIAEYRGQWKNTNDELIWSIFEDAHDCIKYRNAKQWNEDYHKYDYENRKERNRARNEFKYYCTTYKRLKRLGLNNSNIENLAEYHETNMEKN